MSNALIDFEAIAEMARRFKQERVTKYGDDPDETAADLPGVVIVVRDGEQVAQLWQGDGQLAPRAMVYYACLLFDADEVFLVSDSRMKEAPKGVRLEELKDPEPGEFQRDWLAGRRDGLREALVIYRLRRDGSNVLRSYPYDRSGTHLRWASDLHQPAEAGGAIPDNAQLGYTRSAQMMAEMGPALATMAEKLGLEPEQRRYHQDRAVARMASAQPEIHAVVVFTDDPLNTETRPAIFRDGKEGGE